jgi:hypothetical protein
METPTISKTIWGTIILQILPIVEIMLIYRDKATAGSPKSVHYTKRIKVRIKMYYKNLLLKL